MGGEMNGGSGRGGESAAATSGGSGGHCNHNFATLTPLIYLPSPPSCKFALIA